MRTFMCGAKLITAQLTPAWPTPGKLSRGGQRETGNLSDQLHERKTRTDEGLEFTADAKKFNKATPDKNKQLRGNPPLHHRCCNIQ